MEDGEWKQDHGVAFYLLGPPMGALSTTTLANQLTCQLLPCTESIKGNLVEGHDGAGVPI